MMVECISTAEIIWFHRSSTYVIVLPVNMPHNVAHQLLGLHGTLSCVLMSELLAIVKKVCLNYSISCSVMHMCSGN